MREELKRARIFKKKGAQCFAWIEMRWQSSIFIENREMRGKTQCNIEVRETGKRYVMNKNYIRFREDAPLHAPYRLASGRPLASEVAQRKTKIMEGVSVWFWWGKKWNKGTIHSREGRECMVAYNGELIARNQSQISFQEPKKPLYKVSAFNDMKDENGQYSEALAKEAMLKAMENDDWAEAKRIVHRMSYSHKNGQYKARAAKNKLKKETQDE